MWIDLRLWKIWYELPDNPDKNQVALSTEVFFYLQLLAVWCKLQRVISSSSIIIIRA
jgi:hypothetical protein